MPEWGVLRFTNKIDLIAASKELGGQTLLAANKSIVRF